MSDEEKMDEIANVMIRHLKYTDESVARMSKRLEMHDLPLCEVDILRKWVAANKVISEGICKQLENMGYDPHQEVPF